MKLRPPSAGTSAHRRAREPQQLTRQRKLLQEGRGTGEGNQYLPFFQIERAGFQSHGRSHLVYNPSTQRQHHLLSDLELLNFIWAWSLGLADCREQYPLQFHNFDPLFPHLAGKARGTLQIAFDLGIKHPAIKKDEPRVFTTDMLLTLCDGSQIALHVKYSKDQELATPRARQLRKVEEIYWRERGVRFVVASEKPFTSALANQMMWAIDGMHWSGPADRLQTLLLNLETTSPRSSLHERLRSCAAQQGLEQEEAVRGFKYAILTGRWKTLNLQQKLDLSLPWPGKRVRNFLEHSAKTARVRES